MKAEQRKELESNVLAERMGRAVKKTTQRTAPDRRGVRRVALIIFGIIVVSGVSAGFYMYLTNQWTEDSKAWRTVYEGNLDQLVKDVLDETPTSTEQEKLAAASTSQGKAVLFQIAWRLLWDLGVQRVGSNPEAGLNSVEAAEKRYEELLKVCKDDPMWASEALYGLALAKETLAIKKGIEAAQQARKEIGLNDILRAEDQIKAKVESKVDAQLKVAKENWEQLSEKYYGETVWGSKGKQRWNVYKDRDAYEKMKAFYVEYCLTASSQFGAFNRMLNPQGQ